VALDFTKMHGLGNDFVVIDAITQKVELDAERIADLADRNTGIGFDQLLLVQTPDDPDADFRYRIFNTDGSESEQCGNGARCFARFVRMRKLTKKRHLVLQTNTGTIVCDVHGDQVDVDMGAPILEPEAIPFVGDGAAPGPDHRWSLELGELGPVTFVPVSMGNPHAVILVDDVTRAPVETVGPALQRHPAFPRSVNVGFCEVVDAGFARLRVYERGVGETRACGSGACAAVVAAALAGRLGENGIVERAKVSLPGGKLRLAWPGAGQPIRMSGPTAVAFEGRFDP
jgi:diaminopimelate epimerase